ncbi:DNA polymerase subunit gamma-1-like [Styela clava]
MLNKGRHTARCVSKTLYITCEINKSYVRSVTLGSAKTELDYNDENATRVNAMKIQMLPKKLHRQIFKNEEIVPNEALLEKKEACIKKLKHFNLWGKNTEILPNVSFDFPSLIGDNIDEHFRNIATEQCGGYVKSILDLTNCSLPSKPIKWSSDAGWTKYLKNGKSVSVKFPDEVSLIFDCEVLVTEGQMPVMAVAASKDHWYSWCTQRIFTSDQSNGSIEDLIPMQSRARSNSTKEQSRIIVGHNVSYDRARIKEQYFLEEDDVMFVDTMSMHTAISGFTNGQRMLYASARKNSTQDNNSTDKASWLDAGTMNNLSDVHQFYCGTPISKLSRDVFVEGSMAEVRDKFNELMEYCSNDVTATHNVLKKVFPNFVKRFPHPVTMSAVLQMGNMYLPTNKNWQRYVRAAQTTYADLNKELKSLLVDIANEACSSLHDEKYKSDPWLWDLDWDTKSYKLLKQPRKGWEQPSNFKNSTDEKVLEQPNYTETEKLCLDILETKSSYKSSSMMESILNTAASLPKVKPHLPGYPKWYTELCMKENDEDWEPGPVKLSTLTKVTPKLLRMTWYGYCLHHDKSTGWGFLVPSGGSGNIDEEGQMTASEIDLDDVLDSDIPEHVRVTITNRPVHIPNLPEGYLFYKLPHKSGTDYNVGNPLAQDFLKKLDDGVLKSGDAKGASRCLEINQASSYWRSSQQRIKSQMYMKLPEKYIPENIKCHTNYTGEEIGAILPITAVMGTVTRRAVENTWLTAINVQEKKIGSELKSMIQAPPGYTFVGADVDSQELWIASLLGDADSAKEHGCTPFSWMTLQGTKSKGTDLHSKTADAIGITREQAKIFNYARIYGSGERLARTLLKRFNFNMTPDEINKRITQLFRMTKGERKYLLSMDGRYYANKLKTKINPMASRGGLVSYADVKTLESAAKVAFGGMMGMNAQGLIVGRVWDGGMESEMFNRIEKIAKNMCPSTPVLGARISTALEPSKVWENFLPSRMNWVVQSSAVDYMHLLIVCMRWLIDKFNIKARFSISIHDELRYLCAEEDKYRVALALQISNLLTRSMFAYKLGMNDLPLGVAFFSSVEIDKVIRKQHLDDCISPSNPLGLQGSCGIGLGQSLDIFQILEKTNGGMLA